MTSILPSALETELRDGAEYSPELDQLMRKARKASNFLKALSHENRLLLLCLLAERERSVTELENILSMRQSAVSQQLARLRYDGMVDTRRDGKTIYYSIANDDVRRVISVVYDIFCAPVETAGKNNLPDRQTDEWARRAKPFAGQGRKSMQDMSAWTQGLGGFAIGVIAGFAVRHARLCSFGAIEDAMMGGDTRRLRVFGLALGVAILGTQALIVGGIFDPSLSTYTPARLPIVAILIGSVLFGVGMALVGTCGFGSLVRLGAGDLRSLIVILVLGAVAFATLRGILASFRILFLERFAVTMPESAMSDLASLSSRLFAIDARAVIATCLGIALCWLALGDPRLRRTPRLLSAGLILGLAVVAGWLVTLYLRDDFAGPPRPQSLTFVSTIGKSVFAGLLNVANFADFGVGSVFGVMTGSCLAAWRSAELQWEAFDDDREMRRHLAGAVLMGFGGILAGGCTIGQGLTAGSMLALSWPLAVGGMMLGARIGIAVLIDGSPRDIVRRSWTRLVQGRR